MSKRREFMEAIAHPYLTLAVPEDKGGEVKFSVHWSINAADASCWERPCEIELMRTNPGEPGEQFVIALDLSREDMRLLRDFLTSLLAFPDLRQEVDEEGNGLEVIDFSRCQRSPPGR